MNHHRQPSRIAAPSKMAESKTGDEDPKTPEPIVLGMDHRPQYRRHHDRADWAKERLRPPAKHEATDDEFLHDRRRNAAADQEDQQSTGLLGAYIRISQSHIRADEGYGQGLGQQQERRDRQSAQQFA